MACTVLDFATLFVLESCNRDSSSAVGTVTEIDNDVSQGTASGSAQDSTVVEKPTDDISAVKKDSDGKVGQKLVNGGVTLTVTKVQTVETIPMNRTGYETGTELGKITHEKPDNGGKFLRVDTIVENTGSASMDLTCNWPIDAKALDSKNREFDPLDDLYYLENNPECNDGLQPGFTDDMSYIYLIPEDATATSFRFRDTSLENSRSYTNVIFDPSVK